MDHAAEVQRDPQNAGGKASLSPAQQLTYDMATKGASAVSAENLTPIIDWYKTKEG